jgi:hypothetical protein
LRKEGEGKEQEFNVHVGITTGRKLGRAIFERVFKGYAKTKKTQRKVPKA